MADAGLDGLSLADEIRLQLRGLLPGQASHFITLVLVADLFHYELPSSNENYTPLLLVTFAGQRMILGPLLRMDSSVCFQCLLYWIKTASWEGWREPAAIREHVRAVAGLLSETIQELHETGRVDGLDRSLVSIDLPTGQRSRHQIFPRRDCGNCSAFAGDGPVDITRHCSPITGIVQEVEVTADAAAGAFAAFGRYVSPLPVSTQSPLLRRRTALGRGATPEQAIHGCIGEAIERYSLVYRGDEPMARARMAELPAVDPRSLLLYSDSQYASREKWNHQNDERYWVPQPFDPDAAVDWIAGRDLVTGQRVFAPAACCLMWYPFSPEEAEFARADTIGCASGTTFAAALAGALLEIIERDSLAIWWYSRVRRPGMVLESFEHAPLLRLAEQLRRMGRELHLLDITTDVGIPTYAAISPRHDGTEPVFAAAAHPSPAIAAWKAASEVSQIITCVLHKRSADAELVPWIRQATTMSQPYLTPFEIKEAPPEPPPMDAGDQCVWCVVRLKDLGLRPVEVNLTRKDVSLHTVRVLVPGLRHIWNRRAPGRLYDVPLRLGWIEERLEEDGLNSICCMI